MVVERKMVYMSRINEKSGISKSTERIKEYLIRLNKGESLESVRNDFVKEFKEVDAAEIMLAEQRLLRDGTPLEEVQKLCDVHSALFHGKTREERIANTEKAVGASMKNQRMTAAAKLIEISGHPLETFAEENEKLQKIIDECRDKIKIGKISSGLLQELRQLSIHYAKKGDLLYPHLKVKYEISGPSDVMWTVDDEIRDELSKLAQSNTGDEKWIRDFEALLTRAEEMIYKEANILFPNCALNFTEEEWRGIYRDSKDYPECFGVSGKIWKDGEDTGEEEKSAFNEEKIIMAGGSFTLQQLEAMLNTIPLEITFIDDENINRYFNDGPKVFKRPKMAIGREVFSCHPPKIEQRVRGIIDEFRAGKLDKVPVWMEKNERTMLVTYMAVRNKDNEYLGTMELVQDMEFAKEHFAK